MTERVTEEQVRAVAGRAKAAAAQLAPLTREVKDRALLAMADALLAACEDILKANAEDVAAARADGQAEELLGAGDRNRRGQRARLRRRRGGSGDGRTDRAERQDLPAERVQRRRIAAGAPGRGSRVRAADRRAAGRPRRAGAR